MIAARLSPGGDLREQLKPTASERGFVGGKAGDVPTRAVKPGTMPLATGSATFTKTIGIVRVSRRRAVVAGVPFDKMMSGCKPTNSCTSPRIRLISPPYRRRSMRTLRPSVQPKSASAWVSVAELRRFFVERREIADAPHPLRLLRVRRER
jgi:hypothetical protein